MRTILLYTSLFIMLFFIAVAEAADVTVDGRTVLVDGVPYIIKGVCYNPAPVGSDQRDFSNLTEDIALMQEAGINTIRVYSPITESAVLDELADAGIMVITGFGYNQGGNNDILSGTYLDYIDLYKNHDAILFWELGNEYNYHSEWFSGDIANWYTAMNDAASAIHSADPYHLVSTAHGELPDATALSSCPNIDVWGMNVYRWDNPQAIYGEWSSASTKPMYLSEAGADSYMSIAQNDYELGPNEQMQADAIENILGDVMDNTDVGSGVLIFEFTDEWWKAGNSSSQDPGGWAPNSSGVPYDGAPNEEYWGILNIDRTKKAAFDVVKGIFNPGVAIDDINNEDGIVITPNPVLNIVTLEDLKPGYKCITIFDLTGRVQFSKEFNTNRDLNINLDRLNRGIYILKVAYSDSQEVSRFVKR